MHRVVATMVVDMIVDGEIPARLPKLHLGIKQKSYMMDSLVL